jgi:hypothetical protein
MQVSGVLHRAAQRHAAHFFQSTRLQDSELWQSNSLLLMPILACYMPIPQQS